MPTATKKVAKKSTKKPAAKKQPAAPVAVDFGPSKVYKYDLQLAPGAISHPTMPKGSQLLTVQLQGDFAKVWARVPKFETGMAEERNILCVYTGNSSIDSEVKQYLGTVQAKNGLVYHFFEV